MEVVVSVASIVIAVTALIMTYLQIEETRTHNRLSLLPSLSFTSHWDRNKCEDFEIRFELNSDGLGPAIIKDINYCLNDVCMKNALDFGLHVREVSGTDRDSYRGFSGNHGLGIPLKPGKKFEFLKMHSFTDYDSYRDVRLQLENFKLMVTYEGLYGTKLKMVTAMPENLKTEKNNPHNCHIKSMFERLGG